jgi:dCMP deaminase
MKQKFFDAYMKVAETFAELSSAKRLQVGAIVVKDDRIISIGYNGMPSGWDNDCENREWWNPDLEDLHPDELNSMYPHYGEHEVGEYIVNGRYRLKTKPEVLHAETNACAKLAKSTESGDGAVLFVTHSPCLDCAKLVYQSGINSVFYRNSYRSEAGIEFLEKAGVKVTQI